MTLEIVELAPNHRLWQDFFMLPNRIYAGDPNWLRPDPDKLRVELARSNKLQRLPLLALDDGKAAGRMVVQRPAGTFFGTTGQSPGLFGYFEAVDNGDVFKLMADRGKEWLSRRGATKIIGPLDGDTWHKYRFNAGPFTSPPFLLEPYNPPYYPELWKRYGFTMLSRYYTRRIDDLGATLPRMERYYQRTLKNGFHYRQFRVDRYEKELAILHRLSCGIFAENFLYTEIDFVSFRELYAEARPITRPELIWFCLDKNDEYCGFVFALPDYFQAARSKSGHRGLYGKLKFLLLKDKADTVNVKTVGTLPRYRGTGLGPALMYLAYRKGFKLGLTKANMCLMHEANSSLRLDGNQSRALREYHLYHYPL